MKTIFKKSLSKLVLCTMAFALLCTMLSISGFAESDTTVVPSLSNNITDGMNVETATGSFTFAMSALFTTDGEAATYYVSTNGED